MVIKPQEPSGAAERRWKNSIYYTRKKTVTFACLNRQNTNSENIKITHSTSVLCSENTFGNRQNLRATFEKETQ